jgi:hypothetical protein
MDLLIAYGLAEPRQSGSQRPGKTWSRVVHVDRSSAAAAPTPALTIEESDVESWAKNLDADGRLIRRLALQRAWSCRSTRDLGVGFDGAGITIPVRSASGRLRGVLRYDPFGRLDPKMLAVPGTRLGLIPHPARETSDGLILVEGPPDMIAARSCDASPPSPSREPALGGQAGPSCSPASASRSSWTATGPADERPA